MSNGQNLKTFKTLEVYLIKINYIGEKSIF